jgi:hypothetical protein
VALAAAITTLDLEPISFLAAVEYGWSLEKTDAVELEYRAFLQAIHDHPDQPIAPSKDCDLYWHMHLLDTRRYGADCMQIFGRFVHHFPYSGIRGALDLRQQKQRYTRSQRIIGQLLADLRNSAFTHPPETSHETAKTQRSTPDPRRSRRLPRRARSRAHGANRR